MRVCAVALGLVVWLVGPAAALVTYQTTAGLNFPGPEASSIRTAATRR